jgi:O-methyltransferase domain
MSKNLSTALWAQLDAPDLLVSQGPDVALAQQLLAMTLGVAQTYVLGVAAQLGLADLMKDGPRSVAALAAATRTHLPTLARLMAVLTHLGLFVEAGPGQFSCTPLGALLQTDAPHSVRHYAMLMSGEWFARAWPHLILSLYAGSNAFEPIFGMTIYQYVQQHPAAEVVLQQAMSDLSTQEGPAVRDAYDFSPYQTIVDVGGGQGGLLATLLQALPAQQGVLFDLPSVVERTQALSQLDAFQERCQLVGGDFLEAVPTGGDIYILKRILIDRTDAEARTLLSNIRTVIGPQGRLLVADPASHSLYGKSLDMFMLVMFGSRLRSNAEVEQLFAQTGFELTRIVETHSTLRLLEGLPV